MRLLRWRLAQFHHLFNGDGKGPVDGRFLGHQCDGSVAMHPAGAAAESTLQQVQKSRFAGAIGADQGGQAAGLKLEADLINGQLVFVSKAQLLSAEHGGRDGCWVAHDAGTANFFSGFSC